MTKIFQNATPFLWTVTPTALLQTPDDLNFQQHQSENFRPYIFLFQYMSLVVFTKVSA